MVTKRELLVHLTNFAKDFLGDMEFLKVRVELSSTVVDPDKLWATYVMTMPDGKTTRRLPGPSAMWSRRYKRWILTAMSKGKE